MDTADIKIGALIYVKHGIGQQIARVEGFTKSGRIKVRAYNASRGEWMKNLRTILLIDVRGPCDKQISDLAKGWRMGLKDAKGEWLRDERGFVKHFWIALPTLNAEA